MCIRDRLNEVTLVKYDSVLPEEGITSFFDIQITKKSISKAAIVGKSAGCAIGAWILNNGRPSMIIYALVIGIIACTLCHFPDFYSFAIGHVLKFVVCGITYSMVPVLLIQTVPGEVFKKYVANPITIVY